jgi:hypothetical protein
MGGSVNKNAKGCGGGRCGVRVRSAEMEKEEGEEEKMRTRK